MRAVGDVGSAKPIAAWVAPSFVERTHDAAAAAVEDVRVDHRRADVAVTHAALL